MTKQMMSKQDFMELMMGIMTAKLNAKHCHQAVECPYRTELTDDELSFIRTVADNIYTFAVADGMNRAFEAMRRDVLLEKEK